jgi:hypothetical protein
VTQLRTTVLLISLGILGGAEQLVATGWGLVGNLIGGLLCGFILLAGIRALALDVERLYLPPLVAAVASLLGLVLAKGGANVAVLSAAWAAPILAMLPAGAPALGAVIRGARCQICHARLRRLLSFLCPRCHLVTCENCWQFERGRCSLCESNQAPLFPLDYSWWEDRFGSQVHGRRCALCLSEEDWSRAQWGCRSCGHSQCRPCWDDNNGQCSRCGWAIPNLPTEVSEYTAAETRRD